MPSNQAKAIPEPEWNQHKDEIIRLFSTGTMETLRQKMGERGFSATESQYEARLRKWGIRKNGTRDDWKSIGRFVKMREQEGKRTVVYMYGKRISTAKAKKQISRYLSASEMDDFAQAAYPEIPDGFSIETPKEEASFHFPQTEAETTLPIQQITTVNLPSYILEQHFVSRGCTFALGRRYDLEYINPAVLSNRIPCLGREQVVSISNIGTNLYDNALQLISGFRNGTFSNLYPLISTLRSLLPRVAVQDFEGCLNLTLNEEFVNSALTRLVISSTINNFSGLDGIPHSILECLQNPTNMRLLQDLQSANGPEVAAFAEKLFLAAVESSNAGIVEYLLRMNALDPNKLVCNHKGFRYTPIERAVELDSMEVTRVLIHARVDLKKTLERTYGDNRGALETALMIKIPRRYQIRFVNIELVRMLLDAGAVLDPKRLDMDSFCYWDEMDFLLLVTSFHYSASATRHIVKDILVGILRVAVESFKKTDALKYWDLAWSAIVGMAKTDFAKAINFLSQEPEIREFTLNMAAEQGHLELVKALLGSGTIPTAVYLCRGIRSGDEELVRYLLDAGADASGHCSTPAVTNGDLKDGARLLPCWFFPLRSLHPYTTPFAEAIRLGNVQILGILQSRGSWLKIEEKFRFSAALTAAVGVGDIRFARELLDIHSAHELLDMEPILDGEGWLDILLSAVLGNQEEIVMMILDNKAAAIRSKVVEIVWSYECQSRRREFEFEESSIQKALSHASGTGQTSIVRKLLGLSTVFSGRYLSSSLLASIQGNHEQVALMLLDAGANPSSECVGAALSVKNFELVNALLEADAIFEDKPCRHLSQYYLHPLLVLEATKLGDYSILERIVAHGADVDVFYPEPATALTVAVEKQDIRLVQLLLDSGADINLCARYPRVVVTPLAAAVLQGNVTMTGLLLARGANPANAEALYTGLLRNDLITEKLLQAFAKKHPHGKKGFGFEVMARAIKLGNLDIIRQLLLLPVDLGCWTETRKFPRGYLDGLPDQGWITTLGWAIIKDKGKHLDIVQMILEAGDDPNANAFKQYVDCTVFKKTALLVAVDTGNLEIVRLLVGHGAMVNCLTTMGVKRTPLQTAAEIGSFDIAECLLSKGAEINAPPARSGGATSLQLAAIGGYIGIAELLLKLGADPNAPAAKVNGRTAIEGAAEFGRIDMLRLLTNAGAKMDWRQFEIAAWLAEKNGHIATKKYLGAIFHETVSVEELLSQ